MEGQLRELVHLYKFRGRAGIAWELGPLLGRLAEEELSGPLKEAACVTHVPIAPARWRERGFDQSELLARRTAEWLGLPFESLLERCKETSPQTGLPGHQRRRNLQGVFGLRSGREGIEGARVLLVDDVLTTGSTASACARALRKAGAEAVCVVSVCTVLPGGADIG
jgi:ComF family protein